MTTNINYVLWAARNTYANLRASYMRRILPGDSYFRGAAVHRQRPEEGLSADTFSNGILVTDRHQTGLNLSRMDGSVIYYRETQGIWLLDPTRDDYGGNGPGVDLLWQRMLEQ